MKVERAGAVFVGIGLVCMVVTILSDDWSLGLLAAASWLLAVILGGLGWRRGLGKAVVVSGGILLVVGMLGPWTRFLDNIGFLRRMREGRVSAPAAFVGSSTELERTVIVPTLEAAIPEGSNAIWCASFQLAWDRMKNDVVKAPIRLVQVQGDAVAQALNNAEVDEKDLPADSASATALN